MKDDDFKLLRGFADERTDERTNEQTFVIVESLLRLKIGSNGCNITDESICAEVTSIIGY